MSLSNTDEGVEWDTELEPAGTRETREIKEGNVMLKRAFYFYGAEIKCKT